MKLDRSTKNRNPLPINRSKSKAIGILQKEKSLPQPVTHRLIGLYQASNFSILLDEAFEHIRLYPYSIFLHNITGASYIQINDPDTAIKWFSKALKISENFDFSTFFANFVRCHKSFLDTLLHSRTLPMYPRSFLEALRLLLRNFENW